MSHFKSQYKIINLLRQQLCAPKDPIKKGDNVGSIYHIRCDDSIASIVSQHTLAKLDDP